MSESLDWSMSLENLSDASAQEIFSISVITGEFVYVAISVIE